MRVALAQQLGGIDSVELGELPAPTPAAGQALVRVYGAGVGPWDVGFLSGGFPGLALPFVPGQEVAGVVEAAGDGAGVRSGERVYASLFLAGGGFAELALASADRLARMPEGVSFEEAAGLVIGGGTAYEGLVDRGRLKAGAAQQRLVRALSSDLPHMVDIAGTSPAAYRNPPPGAALPCLVRHQQSAPPRTSRIRAFFLLSGSELGPRPWDLGAAGRSACEGEAGSNACAASHWAAVAVLYCCTTGSSCSNFASY